jgi:pyridoxamine 5'-phosphate oxidase family protein
MSFTDEELEYLRSQQLARLATVGPDGQPDVVPVGFQVEGPYIYVTGYDNERTRKFRNVQGGNEKVALVVDDYVSTDPWTPRFLRVYGTAEIVDHQMPFGRGRTIRITPTVSWSWNLQGLPYTGGGTDAMASGPRRTVHQPPS